MQLSPSPNCRVGNPPGDTPADRLLDTSAIVCRFTETPRPPCSRGRGIAMPAEFETNPGSRTTASYAGSRVCVFTEERLRRAVSASVFTNSNVHRATWMQTRVATRHGLRQRQGSVKLAAVRARVKLKSRAQCAKILSGRRGEKETGTPPVIIGCACIPHSFAARGI